VRAWEGVLTPEQLLSALRQVGLFEKEDLDVLKTLTCPALPRIAPDGSREDPPLGALTS